MKKFLNSQNKRMNKDLKSIILPILALFACFSVIPTVALAHQHNDYRWRKVRRVEEGLFFKAHASGAQEVTDPPGGVVTDTSAKIRLLFAKDLSAARFDLDVFKGKAITQAHLHCARAGVNGPIVAFLFNIAPVPGPGGRDVDGDLSSGTITNTGKIKIEEDDFAANESCGVPINNIASLRAAMAAGLIYLNVHSEANPGGEVRGQLMEVRGYLMQHR